MSKSEKLMIPFLTKSEYVALAQIVERSANDDVIMKELFSTPIDRAAATRALSKFENITTYANYIKSKND